MTSAIVAAALEVAKWAGEPGRSGPPWSRGSHRRQTLLNPTAASTRGVSGSPVRAGVSGRRLRAASAVATSPPPAYDHPSRQAHEHQAGRFRNRRCRSRHYGSRRKKRVPLKARARTLQDENVGQGRVVEAGRKDELLFIEPDQAATERKSVHEVNAQGWVSDHVIEAIIVVISDILPRPG